MRAITLLTTAPPGRIFGLDAQMLGAVAIQLFNAIVLAILLIFILYKPAKKMLRDRAERVAKQLERAARDEHAAKELKEQYEGNLQGIAGERREVLESAEALAKSRTNSLLEEAEREVSNLRANAKREIEQQQERAHEALKAHVIELSSMMASKIVENQMTEALSDRLFDGAMRELEGATWPK